MPSGFASPAWVKLSRPHEPAPVVIAFFIAFVAVGTVGEVGAPRRPPLLLSPDGGFELHDARAGGHAVANEQGSPTTHSCVFARLETAQLSSGVHTWP